MNLSTDQADILDRLLAFAQGRASHAVATLEGFAGVGKTTTVAALVRALAQSGEAVAVTAPTHKAVSVLAEKIGLDGSFGVDFMTTQSAMGWTVSEDADGKMRCGPGGKTAVLRDYDLAIIDEASMVSRDMIAALVAQRGACRLLFVGDPFQLPPIGEEHLGAVAFSAQVPLHFKLTQVVRQAEGNPIIRWSAALRAAVERQAAPDLGELAALSDASQAATVCQMDRATMRDWSASALAQGRDTRILAFQNEVVIGHNQALHAHHHPGADLFVAGESVMANSAFEASGLRIRNGEMLSVLFATRAGHPDFPELPALALSLQRESGQKFSAFVPVDPRRLNAAKRAAFDEFNRLKQRAADGAPDLRRKTEELARHYSDRGWALTRAFQDIRHTYALTVHKSQGSTFDTAIVDWPSLNKFRAAPADKSRMLYVAITRPTSYAVIAA